MADEHRHAHAGRDQLDLGVEDLLGLGHHLPLFLGVAVLHEDIDVRDQVEGDPLRKLLHLGLVHGEDRLGLREQLVHRVLAGARDRLIGRHHHARDLGLVVQRLERHHELRGRAVRIGDDALLAEARDGVGIDLGHDQRNVGVVAPVRGIIDHDGAGGGDPGRPFLRHGRARRHQADIDVGEIVMVEGFALERLVAEGDIHALALARRERHDLIGGEHPLGQDPQHLAAHIAGGADHCDLVTHW